MIVICLEGCHGSGKSSLCNHFTAKGYTVLDEAFLDMPEYALHPQSLLMETTWVCAWFERILRRAAEDRVKDTPDEVFIADRSPFSAVFYAANGNLLTEVIREQMKEVLSQGGIEIHTVLVKVDAEILWNRIQARLAREPERVRYNEGKRDWMTKTLSFYDHFHWDASVSNDEGTLDEVAEQVLTVVKKRSAGFESVLVRKRSFGLLSMCGAGEGAAVAAGSQVVQCPVPTRPSAAVLVTPAAAPLAPADKAERFNESESPTSVHDVHAMLMGAAPTAAAQQTADAME